MENNLHRIEKDLRSIAKRYKSVKYSIGLAILFLMLGVSAFSEEVNTKAQVAQIATREELKTSVGDVQTKLNVLRDNNKKEIKNLNLELVQLMEQGAQVVKSPWSSWQFGMNFFYESGEVHTKVVEINHKSTSIMQYTQEGTGKLKMLWMLLMLEK